MFRQYPVPTGFPTDPREEHTKRKVVKRIVTMRATKTAERNYHVYLVLNFCHGSFHILTNMTILKHFQRPFLTVIQSNFLFPVIHANIPDILMTYLNTNICLHTKNTSTPEPLS